MTGIVIERRTAHRPEQHRRRTQASLDGIVGQRIVHRRERRSANQFLLKLDLMTKAVSYRLQHQHRLLSDFRTNAVARKNSEIQKHEEISLLEIAATS